MTSHQPIALIFAAVPLALLIIFGTAALCLRKTVWATTCEVMAHGGAALGFLTYVYFIIPRYKRLFEDFGAEIPDATKVVIMLSDLTVNYWYVFLFLMIPGLVIDALAFATFHRVPESRYVARVFSAIITLALIAQAAFVGFAIFISLDKLMQDLS